MSKEFSIEGDARVKIWSEVVDLQTELIAVNRERDRILGEIAMRYEILGERE